MGPDDYDQGEQVWVHGKPGQPLAVECATCGDVHKLGDSFVVVSVDRLEVYCPTCVDDGVES